MDQKQSKVLRYGQIVRIQGINSLKKKGVLCSKGFTQSGVYFQVYEQLQIINNYRETLFQILPRGSFEIQDEYMKMDKNERQWNKQIASRVDNEREQYFNVIQFKQNEEILFGAEVVFKHFESDTYLMSSDKCSRFRNDAFLVELSEELCSAMIFKILPCFSYQVEGQNILLDEPLRIQTAVNKFWLDSVSTNQIFIDDLIKYDQDNMDLTTDSVEFYKFRPQMRRISYNSQRYEAVVSHNGKYNWQFRYYEGFDSQQEKNKIKPYDLIIFQYTLNPQTYLSTNMFEDLAILKEKKEIVSVTECLDAIWEVQPILQSTKQLQQQQQPIENKAIQNKGYVFRHFLTGKVLTIKSESNIVIQTQTESSDEHLIDLIQARSGQNALKDGQYVKLCHKQKEIQLGQQIFRPAFISFKLNKSNRGSYFQKLTEADLDYKSYSLQLSEMNSSHAFQMIRIGRETKLNLLTISSSLEVLVYFADSLKLLFKELEVIMTDTLLKMIISTLRQLIQFLLNTKMPESESYDGLPMASRQKSFKELYIIELVIEIVYLISFKNDLETLYKKRKNEKEKIKIIYQLIYCLLSKIIKANPAIKLHVSQWIDFFLHQAMMVDDKNVQQTISELLNNNYYAISRFISRTSIQRIIDIMKLHLPNQKYLKILSSICVCEGISIVKNQNHCLDLFFKNNIGNKYRYKLRKEHGRVCIWSHVNNNEPRWRSFLDLYNESLVQDGLQSWEYCVAYFHLLSDICLDRNKMAKQFVDENFSFDNLCCIIEDSQTSELNVIEPIIKVIHYAYIDCDKYPPQFRINRVLEWNNINENPDLFQENFQTQTTPEIDRVITLIMKILSQFKNLSVKNNSQSYIVYSALEVLKKSIVLGFWKKIADLKGLIANLLMICSCKNEFSEFMEDEAKYQTPKSESIQKITFENINQFGKNQKYQNQTYYTKTKSEVTKMNPENLKIMQCKMLACDIIALIFDLESNIKVSKLLYIFKNMVILSTQNNQTEVNLENSFFDPKRRKTSLLETQPLVLDQDEQKTKTAKFLNKKLNSAASNFRRNDIDRQFYDSDLWAKEFKNLIDQRAFLKSDNHPLELIFAEISLFENPQMAAFALKILSRINGQRKELMQNFEKALIVADGQTLELFKCSKQIMQKFYILNDTLLVRTEGEVYDKLIWAQGDNFDNKGLIQHLYFLCQSLKKLVVLDQIDYADLTPMNGLYRIYNEKEQNQRINQSLLKSLEIYMPVIRFIQNCHKYKPEMEGVSKLLHQSYLFLTMLAWNNIDNKMELSKYRSFMYDHLTENIGVVDFFIELFANNKILLYSEREIPFIVDKVVCICDKLSINKYYKSKLLSFLRVLLIYDSKPIKPNQFIVMQKLQEDTFQHIMIQLNFDIIKIDDTDYQQIICDIVEQNQKRSSKFNSRSVSNDSSSVSSDQKSSSKCSQEKSTSIFDYKKFIQWIADYQYRYDNIAKHSIIDIGPQLTYIESYFQLLALLIYNKNDINSEKCMQMHPYRTLLELIAQSNSCWPVKRQIRSYINRLYYIQQNYENISQSFIEIDLACIIGDLQEIIDIKSDPNKCQVPLAKLKNPVRFQYLYTYIQLNLEECLITLTFVLNNDQFLVDLEDILIQNQQTGIMQTHLQLFELGAKLSQIERFYSNEDQIMNVCKVLKNILRIIYRTIDINVLVMRDALQNSVQDLHTVCNVFQVYQRQMIGNSVISEFEKTIEHQLNNKNKIDNDSKKKEIQKMEGIEQNEREILIDQILQVKDSHIHRKIINVFKQYDQKPKEADKNEVLNHRHRKLISILNLSQSFQRFLDDEFINVCDRLSSIGEQSKLVYETTFAVTDTQEFISNIINMYIKNPSFLADDMKVFFFQILTRMITEKNLNNREQSLSADQWSPEYWNDYRDDVERTQIFLDDCGAGRLIYHIFCESQLESRINLTAEILNFVISYLLGGNAKNQNSLLQLIKQDKNNTVLTNFSIIIRRISKIIDNNFQIKYTNTKLQDYQIYKLDSIDDYDHLDPITLTVKRYNVAEPDNAAETAFKKQCLDIVCRFYRVLQLMCENNNVAMKKYIRQQTDIDGNVRLDSINFIEFTIIQLRLFLKILSRAVIQIPAFILDFLIEIIQLPCVDNQITFCKTTFFEDVSYMSEFFSEKQNRKMRLFNTQEDLVELYDLHNKIILVVLSVFEGNDEKIYEDIENKLDGQVFIEILKYNLEVLKVKEIQDLQNILNKEKRIFSDQIVRLINIPIIIKKIQHRHPRSKWLIQLKASIECEKKYDLSGILLILESNIRNIEIVYQNQKIILFYVDHPIYKFLSDHTQEQILFKVNRQSQREKLFGLLEQKEIIFFELEHNYKLNQMFIPVNQRKIDILSNISSLLSILVNIGMILSYTVIIKDQTPIFHTGFFQIILLRILTVSQFTSQIVLFIFVVINRAPIILQNKFQNTNQSVHDTERQIVIDKINLSKIKNLKYKLYNLRYLFKKSLAYSIKYSWGLIQKSIIVLKSEDDFFLLLGLVVLSFCGVFYGTVVFVIHLVEIFSRVSLLKNVFQAISYNAKQLFMVAFLGVLFVFSFSVVSFHTYFDDIYPEISSEKETCNTLIRCMITLITSGVIGNSMTDWDPIKFFFDMMYIIFFGLLFTNIVSGIMIDTFAELRDQRQKIEDDIQNLCFICGVERLKLEKNNQSFEEHINSQHQIWNYIYYIYGLMNKDLTELSGLEYWLKDNIINDNICWFPIIEDTNDTNEKLDQIKTQLDKITNIIKPPEENIYELQE